MINFYKIYLPLILLGPLIIGLLLLLLKRIQVYQNIYEKSPDRHQKKAKTVSLGGVGIALIILLGHILWGNLNSEVLWVLGLFFAFALVGFIDDFTSFIQKKNLGLTAKQKLRIQCLIAALALGLYHTGIAPLSLWQWGFYIFLIVGTSNATNLTDGLDGLLSGLSLITLTGFGLFFIQINRPEWTPLCIIVGIAVASFLLFNRHPAKIFMGDTGSLALGASFAAMAIIGKNPFILIPFGCVYLIETLSVILQVSYFKKTKKRLFLMSPLHHHFELLGFSEWTVVSLFWIIGLTGLGLWIYL